MHRDEKDQSVALRGGVGHEVFLELKSAVVKFSFDDKIGTLRVMTLFFILHGWGGTSQSNWFPWLRRRQEAAGDTTFVPDFPSTELPWYSEWCEYWEANFAQQITPDSVVVGHSLGGSFALRWLSEKKSRSHDSCWSLPHRTTVV